MPKNCISIYNEFSNIGPTRRTWTWRFKVNQGMLPHPYSSDGYVGEYTFRKWAHLRDGMEVPGGI